MECKRDFHLGGKLIFLNERSKYSGRSMAVYLPTLLEDYDRPTDQPTDVSVCVCGRHISIFPFHLSVYLQSCCIPLPYLSCKDDKFKRCGQECWRCQPADRTPSPQEKGGDGMQRHLKGLCHQNCYVHHQKGQYGSLRFFQPERTPQNV